MKRITVCLLSALMLLIYTAIPTYAANPQTQENNILNEQYAVEPAGETLTGQCGDHVTWSLDTDTGELYIKGAGDMYDYMWFYNVPWISYAENIKTVRIRNDVTSIGSYAFQNCVNLESVIIPEGVKKISTRAFTGCTSLKSITIPSTIESIGGWAFQQCSELAEVNVTDLAAWCGISFENALSNPAFYSQCIWFNGQPVSDLIIPSGVTSICDYAFYGFKSLKNVTIPDSVTKIGKCAFSECSSLTSIIIPANVTSIGNYAFQNCFKLYEVINHSSLNITKGSENNGYVAYYAKIVHSGNESMIDYINGYIFMSDGDGNNYLIGYDGGETDLILPDDYKGGDYRIANDCFRSNTRITRVSIPGCIKAIGKHAFSACTSLKSVVMSEGVESIDDYAFSGCSLLSDVAFPQSLTSVSSKAFNNSRWYADQPDGLIYIGKILYKYKGTMPLYASVVISDGTESVADYAFEGCYRNFDVSIPISLKRIGECAFESTMVGNIYYEGSEEQWNEIEIGTGNEHIQWAADKHYNIPLHTHEYTDVVTKATCLNPGYITHTCTICGHWYNDAHIDPLGHYFSEWQVADDPAYEIRYCMRHDCDYYQTRVNENPPLPSASVGTNGRVFTISDFGAGKVSYIRFAKGEISSEAEMKTAPDFRSFGAKYFTGDTAAFAALDAVNGESTVYTVQIRYTDGHNEFITFEITPTLPAVTVSNGTVTVSNVQSDTYSVDWILCAPGELTSYHEIRHADGLLIKKTADISNDTIIFTGLPAGNYTLYYLYDGLNLSEGRLTVDVG
ncbi:MAG: leucine-rich repeat protein [Clostridia bacterium]|nr:leucine-rich repeat protein [Clostridia bacterium]